MDISRVTNNARRSIGSFCSKECKAYCCRKGHLVLTLPEAKIVSAGKMEELIRNQILRKLDDARYTLLIEDGCPSLVDSMCSIHKSRRRPQTCKDFPIYLDMQRKQVYLSSRCLAVSMGKLYVYARTMRSIGFRISYGRPESDFVKLLDDKPKASTC